MKKEYPDVRADQYHVDGLTIQMVLNPDRFDVIVASNLFGDILSDLGPATAGTIGIAASGNINPTREYPSIFEPVHGSAPDIAGRKIANPIAPIWSGALMLEHLGHAEAAADIVRAIERVIVEGPHTPDMKGKASTSEVGAAVAEAVRARVEKSSLSARLENHRPAGLHPARPGHRAPALGQPFHRSQGERDPRPRADRRGDRGHRHRHQLHADRSGDPRVPQRHRRARHRRRPARAGTAVPQAVRADLAAARAREGMVARSDRAHLRRGRHRLLGHHRQGLKAAAVPVVRRLSQRSAVLRDVRVLPRRQDAVRAARRNADAERAGAHGLQGESRRRAACGGHGAPGGRSRCDRRATRT